MNTTPTSPSPCPLCADRLPWSVLWHDDELRVVVMDEATTLADGLMGFTRLIWRAHVTEMSDLQAHQRNHLWDVLMWIEALQREHLQPHKVNLASLGNQVPHLHWHVVPRWQTDAYFPGSVWSVPQRKPAPLSAPQRVALETYLAALRAGP